MDCEEVRVGMLNKLHFEMIKLYNGDAKEYSIFVKSTAMQNLLPRWKMSIKTHYLLLKQRHLHMI